MTHPRAQAWLWCLLTTCVAVGLHELIAHLTGFNLYTLTILVALPVGAVVLGFVALSGFWVVAKRSGIQTNPMDLVLLTVICLAFGLLIHIADYLLALQLAHAPGATVVGFQSFLVSEITDSVHVMRHPMAGGTVSAKTGEFGWLLFIARVAGLAATAKIVHSQFARSPFGRQ